eukprot:TRINITY_DN7272_c0_g1_i1.p1 TRINITY_DN7272_c0_g1~~TRINITY_DN7272_c0_g1_i1.p1  ORF type:complete len:270 (-),score=90.77 TRINITY_DN7272_c0_g1_i1:65-874(-)
MTAAPTTHTYMLRVPTPGPAEAPMTGADNLLEHFGLQQVYLGLKSKHLPHDYKHYVEQMNDVDYCNLYSGEFVSLSKLAREAPPPSDLPMLHLDPFSGQQLKAAFTLQDGGVPQEMRVTRKRRHHKKHDAKAAGQVASAVATPSAPLGSPATAGAAPMQVDAPVRQPQAAQVQASVPAAAATAQVPPQQPDAAQHHHKHMKKRRRREQGAADGTQPAPMPQQPVVDGSAQPLPSAAVLPVAAAAALAVPRPHHKQGHRKRQTVAMPGQL